MDKLLKIEQFLLPAVLCHYAFPSFILLYLCDEVISPAITIKAIGYQ